MFDAGAIMAHVDIDTHQADLDLDRIERRVHDMERGTHHIRLDAVFDNASVGKARQIFANLDNALSRDAANRLRSNPQGSVLGALNSLFSPHQVTGAPSAAQSAQQGALGRMAQGQASSMGTMPGAPQQLAAQQQNERINRTITTDVTNKVHEDKSGFLSGLGLGSMLGGGGGGHGLNLRWHLGTGGAGVSGNFGGRLAAGIGPSILGMGLKTTGIVGGGGALLGALPGLLGPASALGLGGVGLGVGALGFRAATSTVAPLVQQSQQIQQQLLSATGTQRTQLLAQQAQITKSVAGMAPALQSLFSSMNSIENRWQAIGQSLAPAFVKPLAVVASTFRQLSPLITSTFRAGAGLITPFVKGLGDVAHMVLPLLIQGFHIVQPAIRPLIDGIGKLVAGILPGLNSIIRASLPIIKPFGDILGMLGRDIGGLFSAMAPAVKASEPIFRALMSVLGAIFPIVGKVAAEFAKVLGPVFVSLAKTVTQLLPILKPVGVLIAQLAAAILSDLGSAFQAVLILIRDMEPSIRILAKALGGMFQVLENSGVFAIMGDALEKLAPLIAQLVNQLVRALVPILPILIKLVAQWSQIMITLLAAGLGVVLKGLTTLITVFGPLLKWLALATIADYAFGAALAFVAANPVVLIIAAIVALIGGIVLLVKHWGQAWQDIKNWAQDAWNFLTHGWGQFLFPELTAIRLAIAFVADHWKGAWNDITGAASDAWNWLLQNVWDPMKNFLTNTLPGWWDDAVSAVKSAWNGLEDVVKAPVNFVIRYILDDGLIKAFNWISSKVGGPTIKPIPTLAGGGIVPGGYGGGDVQPALLEPGETVIPKEKSRSHAWLWKMLGIPGYQAGGTVPPGRFPGLAQPKPGSEPFGGGVLGDVIGAFKKAYDVGRIMAAIASGNTTALSNAFYALMGHSVGGAVGEMAALVTDIPKTLVHDAVHWLISEFTHMAGGGGGKIPPGGLGRASLRQIEDYWIGAGGPGGMIAHIAAAITGAESGFNPRAVQQGQPYATTGWGLWQITPGNSEPQFGINQALLNPHNNAEAAVAKYRGAGGFSPWTTYVDGAYRQFMDQGGWLGPGPNLSFNATGAREAVLTPAQSEAFVAVGEAARLFARGHGGTGTGAVMRDVYLMLPEGSTVAQAMNEITFRLTAAQMAGYARVVP